MKNLLRFFNNNIARGKSDKRLKFFLLYWIAEIPDCLKMKQNNER